VRVRSEVSVVLLARWSTRDHEVFCLTKIVARANAVQESSNAKPCRARHSSRCDVVQRGAKQFRFILLLVDPSSLTALACLDILNISIS
jgi:hypothetical protein